MLAQDRGTIVLASLYYFRAWFSEGVAVPEGTPRIGSGV
jgi:hypothetical protein